MYRGTPSANKQGEIHEKPSVNAAKWTLLPRFHATRSRTFTVYPLRSNFLWHKVYYGCQIAVMVTVAAMLFKAAKRDRLLQTHILYPGYIWGRRPFDLLGGGIPVSMPNLQRIYAEDIILYLPKGRIRHFELQARLFSSKTCMRDSCQFTLPPSSSSFSFSSKVKYCSASNLN